MSIVDPPPLPYRVWGVTFHQSPLWVHPVIRELKASDADTGAAARADRIERFFGIEREASPFWGALE